MLELQNVRILSSSRSTYSVYFSEWRNSEILETQALHMTSENRQGCKCRPNSLQRGSAENRIFTRKPSMTSYQNLGEISRGGNPTSFFSYFFLNKLLLKCSKKRKEKKSNFHTGLNGINYFLLRFSLHKLKTMCAHILLSINSYANTNCWVYIYIYF